MSKRKQYEKGEFSSEAESAKRYKASESEGATTGGLFTTTAANALDPSVDALFKLDSGPVKVPNVSSKLAATGSKSRSSLNTTGTYGTKELNEVEKARPNVQDGFAGDETLEKAIDTASHALKAKRAALKGEKQNDLEKSERKSKRRLREDEADNLEALYLDRLVKVEEQEWVRKIQERREITKAQLQEKRHQAPAGTLEDVKQQHKQYDVASDDDSDDIPLHESLEPSTTELETAKAARTVFLGNVSTEAITAKSSKKALKKHLCSFFSKLSKGEIPHKVDSIRFRSTAYGVKLSKRAAYARQDLKPETSQRTNAYAVYSTMEAALAAPKHLNGSVILGRHLRVDHVQHPARIDHRRCVFVGNLDFVDDASQITAVDDGQGNMIPKKKRPPPSDVEEGLWEFFGRIGDVENVRVIRDPVMEVGKGFGYVQFKDDMDVERALLLDGQTFPPKLPRTMRVVRAKKQTWKPEKQGTRRDMVRKLAEEETLRGRVGKLLGKAGPVNMLKDLQQVERFTSIKPNKGQRPAWEDSVKRTKDMLIEGVRKEEEANVKAAKREQRKRQKKARREREAETKRAEAPVSGLVDMAE